MSFSCLVNNENLPYIYFNSSYHDLWCEFEDMHQQIFFQKFYENPTLPLKSSELPLVTLDFHETLEGKSAGKYLKIHTHNFYIYDESEDKTNFRNLEGKLYPKFTIILLSKFVFQVRTDYLKSVAEIVDMDTAFQLGVLEMKRFFNNMPQVALDKKSNLDFIE